MRQVTKELLERVATLLAGLLRGEPIDTNETNELWGELRDVIDQHDPEDN